MLKWKPLCYILAFINSRIVWLNWLSHSNNYQTWKRKKKSTIVASGEQIKAAKTERKSTVERHKRDWVRFLGLWLFSWEHSAAWAAWPGKSPCPSGFMLKREDFGTASMADHKGKDTKKQEVEAMHHQCTWLNPYLPAELCTIGRYHRVWVKQ